MLPASLHCLPNPLKHHVCSIEISLPPLASSHYLLLTYCMSVADWWSSLFLPISCCPLLEFVTYWQVIWVKFDLLFYYLFFFFKCRHTAQKDNVSSNVKGNSFPLSNQEEMLNDWCWEVFINSVKVETALLQLLWNLPNRIIWQLSHLIEVTTNIY